MRKQLMLFALGTMTVLGACSKTEDGDVVVKRPADVDVKTTTDTVKMPQVTSKIDTINTPVVGTQKETLIVNKPVVGTKKTEVKTPVIKRP
jgi:hypothetical protein